MQRLIIFDFFLCLLWSGTVMAHAAVERTIPASGSVISVAPNNVIIYFDAELEPFFSKVIVRDARGAKVSVGDGELARDSRKILATKLSSTGRGAYRVYWNVVSHDGHRAKGDFGFTVK